MLAILLALLPKVGPAVAALPDFKALIDQLMTTLSEDDQATLKQAYDLARDRSDKAHDDLQQLVAERLARQD